ncbi:type I glyceraldehyde-3-phosphate dehydrogenase [Candidatus Gottesmanbacteria bacterium RIFCSPHIGHO2_01_FULL_39_10]|uniref:Glyceraldehyde-3-phosphate dehydrogenase n=1 Tax=Candidatus Gottesmanbacteria bacterium RIFCSPHIGHO2_01_FULL_39_10 TaxID=1798375 RepID=A0A1F5ZQJ7_9BACT|nr:MAG: type I glyceraldehyde-3-phosphate dehydrogenase [Candidatus Gottesmanbacteria bacterium RIFCSPHIGHO2_01_FULL_39_10]
MKTLKVGINGFGRIGRNAARIILGKKNLELVAINSRAEASSHAYLLKYDTTYGTLENDVKVDGENLSVDGKKIAVFRNDLPEEIPWKEAGVDIVIESSGKFRTTEDALGHTKQGAKYVVISAPAKDDTKTLVLGVNEENFDPGKDIVISNSSCTTNCLSTVVKVLHEKFKIKIGYMTTVHAVTDSQNLLDNSHKKDARLRRASFTNMIPTSTGSAKDIGKLYKDLKGKIVCKSLRVPLLTGSIIDLTVEVAKTTTRDDVNAAYKKYSEGELKGILGISQDQLVSSDYVGSPYSSIVDTYMTETLGNLVKVYAWYDNEWGYTTRLVEMIGYVAKKGKLV